MVDLSSVFGTEHTWEELRLLLMKYLRKKFFASTHEQREDAAGDAILALVDYWSGLASSMTDDVSRNWNYAKWYATRKAAAQLYKELHRGLEEVSLDTPVNRVEGGAVVLRDVLVQQPDEPLSDAEYQERVAQFIDAIPEGEMEAWLSAVVSGETVRGEAERTGVGRMSVQRKRMSGKRRLTTLAERYGLRVAA